MFRDNPRCLCVFLSVCVCVSVRAYVCVRVRVCVYVCMCAYTIAHMYIYMHIHMTWSNLMQALSTIASVLHPHLGWGGRFRGGGRLTSKREGRSDRVSNAVRLATSSGARGGTSAVVEKKAS